VVESLDGVKCAINIRIEDACGSFAPRQRESSEGTIRSLQQEGILNGLIEQMKMVLSLLYVEVVVV